MSKDTKRNPDGTWKKGQTGNPDGRPKGSPSIVAAIKRKLKDEYEGCDSDLQEKKTYLDKVVEKYFDEIIESGDKTLLRDVIDRTDGKPVQTNKIEADVESKVLKERNENLAEIFEQVKKDN